MEDNPSAAIVQHKQTRKKKRSHQVDKDASVQQSGWVAGIYQLRGDEPLDEGIATSVVCPPLSLGELYNQRFITHAEIQ